MAAGGKETGGAVSALGFGTTAPRPAAGAKNDDNDDEDEGILDDDAARGILLAGDAVQAEYIGCIVLILICCCRFVGSSFCVWAFFKFF